MISFLVLVPVLVGKTTTDHPAKEAAQAHKAAGGSSLSPAPRFFLLFVS